MESRAQLLSRAHSGDRDAVQQMIEENTGLIWSVARRYFGRGVDADDLYQLGCLGFLKAIEGFDERFGTQFSTYAVPKIAGEIRRFLRDDGAVKVSRGLKERAQQIHAARRRLEQQVINLRFFHGLTQSDCARILSVSQVQVSRLERRAMENLRAVML